MSKLIFIFVKTYFIMIYFLIAISILLIINIIFSILNYKNSPSKNDIKNLSTKIININKYLDKPINNVDTLIKRNNDLNIKYKSSEKYIQNLLELKIGNRVLYEQVLVQQIDEKEKFKVLYEVEIIDISINKIKVKGLDFKSNGKYPNIPANKNIILQWMNDKWINKSEVDLIINNSHRRENKINQILK